VLKCLEEQEEEEVRPPPARKAPNGGKAAAAAEDVIEVICIPLDSNSTNHIINLTFFCLNSIS
jgi:hypothetical protein